MSADNREVLPLKAPLAEQGSTATGADHREDQDNTQRLKLRPHAKWANKFIALYQGTLPQAEREDLEAHLRGCLACSEAYLVYTEVADIVQNLAVLSAPSELHPALQKLKEGQLAKAAQRPRNLEAPARPRQTLNGLTDEPPRKKRSAQKTPPPAAPPTDAAPEASASRRRSRG
jgi:anti-sigma factor RsiW